MAESSYQKILDFLGRVLDGRMKVRRREAALIASLAVLGVLLLAPAAVALQPLFGYTAVIYLALSAALLGSGFAWAYLHLRRGLGRESLALEIESERPDLGSNLISSLQLYPRKGKLGPDDPTSPELIDALVEDTSVQIRILRPAEFVPEQGVRDLRRLAGWLGAAALACALLWPGLYPRAAYLLVNAFDLMPLRITHVFLTASADRVLPGSPISFEVRTEGRKPGGVTLEIAPAEKGAEGAGRLPMEKAGEDRYRVTWAGGERDVRVTAWAGRFHSIPVDVKVVQPPQVTAIEVVYFPPEYTGLKPSRGEEEGHIRAYLGSTVHVRVRADRPLAEAVLAMADGWRVPLKLAQDGALEGVLLLTGPGSYQVRLKDTFGFANPAPPRYRIDIVPDTAPKVEVTEPGKDLTVEADEQVGVRFQASDDFGVRSVSLEVRVGSGPARHLRVWGGETPQKAVDGTHLFDLRSIGLRPGAVLTYRFVAEDTDTVSGPKKGFSAPFTIRIRDREAAIAKLDEDLGKISSQILDLLADFLEKGDRKEEEKAPAAKEAAGKREPQAKEAPAARKGEETRQARRPAPDATMTRKAENILEAIQKARTQLRPQNPREALASMDLDALQRQLRDTLERFLRPAEQAASPNESAQQRRQREEDLASRQEEATETLERLASMGEDIQRNVRMDRVGRSADSLLQRQQALERTLEKLRREGGMNDEAQRRLEQELAELQREMSKLMQELSSLAQRMPAEFMNQRGMRNLPMQDMMKGFDRIRDMMRQGNLRGALEALRQMMGQMQRMRAALRGMQQQQMMAQRGGSPMRSQQNELSAIVEEQQAILGETVSLLDNAVDRLKKGASPRLKGLADQIARERKEEQALAGKAGETVCVQGKPKPAKAAPPMDDADADAAMAKAVEQAGRARQQAMEEMESLLQRGDWGAIYHRMREWWAAMRGPECVEDKAAEGRKAKWEEARKQLERLLQGAERSFSAEERAGLSGLKGRQEALKKRLASFEERLRQLMQVFPFIDPAILRRIVEAGQAMGQAQASLGRRSPSQAVPPEEEAIQRLAQGQSAMQQAMQQMAQRGNFGMGTPQGFGVYRAPGTGWWARNPEVQGQEDFRPQNREGEEGQLGTQFSEVLIPDRDQYRVPPQFREEVMEALKDGMPGGLRGEIEDYFDRLTK
ncbi:MAG: hypothetical protein A3I72_09165 [Candidatus Tectomicrobia bacterium RIFCSPLOWO2_02_FULL_70_19]|nr:MAG: hypothetical protein A3I72_09165 [Candidatus Tectomicrobia bacterium RIFCSPLOWO2_02_FULL_70_19]